MAWAMHTVNTWGRKCKRCLHQYLCNSVRFHFAFAACAPCILHVANGIQMTSTLLLANEVKEVQRMCH